MSKQSIYLASPYGRREYLRESIAPALREAGHRITSSWINDPPENDEVADYLRDRRKGEGDANPMFDAMLAHEAERDVLDLRYSSMIIRFPAADLTTPSSGGKFWETGFAYGGLPVVVIGNRECVFDYLPKVKVFPTFMQACFALDLL